MAIEIVSKSSQHMDYLIKLFKYRTAGVREYWIVNPMKRTVLVYIFGEMRILHSMCLRMIFRLEFILI